jgi:hypothetical protein
VDPDTRTPNADRDMATAYAQLTPLPPLTTTGRLRRRLKVIGIVLAVVLGVIMVPIAIGALTTHAGKLSKYMVAGPSAVRTCGLGRDGDVNADQLDGVFADVGGGDSLVDGYDFSDGFVRCWLLPDGKQVAAAIIRFASNVGAATFASSYTSSTLGDHTNIEHGQSMLDPNGTNVTVMVTDNTVVIVVESTPGSAGDLPVAQDIAKGIYTKL